MEIKRSPIRPAGWYSKILRTTICSHNPIFASGRRWRSSAATFESRATAGKPQGRPRHLGQRPHFGPMLNAIHTPPQRPASAAAWQDEARIGTIPPVHCSSPDPAPLRNPPPFGRCEECTYPPPIGAVPRGLPAGRGPGRVIRSAPRQALASRRRQRGPAGRASRSPFQQERGRAPPPARRSRIADRLDQGRHPPASRHRSVAHRPSPFLGSDASMPPSGPGHSAPVAGSCPSTLGFTRPQARREIRRRNTTNDHPDRAQALAARRQHCCSARVNPTRPPSRCVEAPRPRQSLSGRADAARRQRIFPPSQGISSHRGTSVRGAGKRRALRAPPGAARLPKANCRHRLPTGRQSRLLSKTT